MKRTLNLLIFLFMLFSLEIASAATNTLTPESFIIHGVGTSLVPVGLKYKSAVGTEAMTSIETQYDLTSSTKDGTHYARLIIYKDPRNLGLAGSILDVVDFKPALFTMLSDMGKNLISQKIEEHGLTLLEWLPVSKTSVQNHNGIQMGLRFAISDKFPMPMFATIAVYAQNGNITGIALLAPDSDAKYWQPVFTQMIRNIK